jgi:hypothetical protein
MVSQNSRRAAKFYKAQDWKTRMEGYINEFTNHRVELQRALSLYTTSNVNVLVTKMSDLVSQLFATEPDWEKALATMTQKIDRSKWLESDATLQDVVSAAEDPVLGGIVTKKIEPKSKEKQPTKLSELRDELELTLDVFCKRNKEIFEVKLAFQTQQLQDAIASSAQFVVRTLSGPYDRLLHEVRPFAAGFVYHSPTVFYQDLRELWKEMVSLGLG